MSLPYYLRYPDALLDATEGWPGELKGVYSLLLDLIYRRDGNLEDHPQTVAGHLGYSVRAWNRFKTELVRRGKIKIIDGIIRNSRADDHLITRRSYQENQAKKRIGKKKIKALEEPRKPYLIPSVDIEKKDVLSRKKQQPTSAPDTEAPDLFAAPPGFRERCKQAAGACLKPKVREFALIADLLRNGWSAEQVVSTIEDIADGKAAASISTWKYFSTALTNRRAQQAQGPSRKPTASAGPDEPMPKEQGVIVARWSTIRNKAGELIARLDKQTGELRKPDFTPFDGEPPPEIAQVASTRAEAA